MVGNILDDNKKDVMSKLLEVINKGVYLLVRENLSKDLLDSWNNLADSALRLVDTVYNTNYAIGLDDDDWFSKYTNPVGGFLGNLPLSSSPYRNPMSGFPMPDPLPIIPQPWSANSLGRQYAAMSNNNLSNEYKTTLQKALQRLITIAKRISNE